MVIGLGPGDFIRLQMIAVMGTMMIFQGWDWRICFQAINAHVNVSKSVFLLKY